MSQEFSRIERINEFIKRELATLIIRELKDPRLGMITITRVDTAKDFSHAKVYFTALRDDKKYITQQVNLLNHAAGYLHQQLRHSMHTRNTPELRFYFDETFRDVLKLEGLIDKAAEEDIGDDE